MSTRREFIQSAAGLLIPSAVFADQFEFTPLPKPPATKPKPENQHNDTTTLPRPAVYTLRDFRLDMYTASYCGPCRAWKATEEKRVSVNVNHLSPSGVSSIPTFRLKIAYPLGSGRWSSILRGKSTANGVDRDAKHIQWTGYTPADQINREIERQVRIRNASPAMAPEVNREIRKEQPPRRPAAPRQIARASNTQTSGRWTMSELRAWIKVNYTRNTAERHATVSPRSGVWRHLASRTHGFVWTQVDGLSQWEALALHSAVHVGQIRSVR